MVQKLSRETHESFHLMKKNESYLWQRLYKVSIVHISSEK